MSETPMDPMNASDLEATEPKQAGEGTGDGGANVGGQDGGADGGAASGR